ncbi:hypothetical protein [Sutcliffiella rhizosphaerae]|uniref:Uncharacterized protein n=1 Tax=Sutcliffiella rhizosphaerae TaxID=2880967 RepID=A0ABN8AAV2_9BACI|nr:hypothetical protein [Sutcliffiella rhizosphaerae]CAG9621604.1 hypothetical protein BACCIP111883_02377 [Sutcliffiella rhizosphaerae]
MPFGPFWTIILSFAHLIGSSLILAIFNSLYFQSRKKAYILLSIFVIVSFWNVYYVYQQSIWLTVLFLLNYTFLSIASIFVIKKKAKEVT